jgi:hypothetical protein
MSFESVDFFVVDTTPTANPVAGVVVKILSQDGTQVFSQVTTDVNGHAGFLLPAGPAGTTYQARFFKFAVSFINPQLFVVNPSPLQPGQSNAFNVVATLITPPVPTDARLCTAYGYFRDITGAPQAYVEIHIIAEFDPVWVEGSAVLKERVIFRTDENGYAQVNLFRCAHYNCTIQGEEDVVRKLRVPDAPNVNLPDLIFPIVSQIVLDPPGGAYTIATGQEYAIGMDVFASDGENLHLAVGDILLSTSNPDVLSYAFSPGGLVLIGVAPGTAQINIKRANRSIVHIPDPGITNGVISVTVT